MSLILGIDDAGRGPLIGPMFLAGVLIKPEDEKMLKSEGVKDSKKVLHPKRIKLAGLIKDTAVSFYVAKSDPDYIDHSINSGVNLNTLEAIKTAEIINALTQGQSESIKVVVDCPSTNIKAWRSMVLLYVKDPEKIEVICEHKADVNHPAVSAASILAKVAREESVEELKKTFGDFGSGYPSDPVTKEFLQKNGTKYKDSGIFRKTWATWKDLFPGEGQSTLKV